jgi:hypothetical protein
MAKTLLTALLLALASATTAFVATQRALNSFPRRHFAAVTMSAESSTSTSTGTSTSSRISSSSSSNSVSSRRQVLSTAASAFSIAGLSAPAFALRDPTGASTGGGKYDTQMDALTAAAMYGTGQAQMDARKALRAQGKSVPKPK